MKCDSCGRLIAAIPHEGTDFHRSGDLIICHTCHCERQRALDYRRRVREERERMEWPDWVKREIEEPPPDGRTAALLPIVEMHDAQVELGEAFRALVRAAEGAADLIRAIRPACDHHREYQQLIDALDRARGMLGERVPEHRSGRVGK